MSFAMSRATTAEADGVVGSQVTDDGDNSDVPFLTSKNLWALACAFRFGKFFVVDLNGPYLG